MKITSGILAVAAASGALLAATAPAHADADTDILNLVNAKRVPVSVLSEGNTSADNIQVTNAKQGADTNVVAREARRPYGDDVAEALLANLMGHDLEE